MLNYHVYLSLFIQAGEAVLDDVIGLKDSSAVFTPERDRGGTGEEEKEEEQDSEDTRMGVGKNTTYKSLDSSSEGGKYEEETKHGADFYPIPVCDCLMALIMF